MKPVKRKGVTASLSEICLYRFVGLESDYVCTSMTFFLFCLIQDLSNKESAIVNTGKKSRRR